jgi:two-component system OmpR family sensor kinase
MSGPEPSAPAPRRWSLQQRLWWRLLGLLVAGWLAAAGAAMGGLWHETSEVLDAALQQTALRLLRLPPATLEAAQTPAWDPGEHGEYVSLQLFDAQGRLLLRAGDAPSEPMDPSPRDGLRDVGRWHVLTLNAPDGRRALVAETIAHRREVLWHSLRWMVLALLAVLPLVALGLRWVIARAFRGVLRARAALAALDTQRLQPLQGHDLPDELAPWLAGTNELLARLRALVEAERASAAHAAHELRQPLAAARAQAQRLALATPDEAARGHADALVQQLDRLTRLSTRLLQLARLEGGAALRNEPLDLAQLAELVVGEFDAERRAGRLRLQLPAGPLPLRGDVDALGIALRNLIDNALRHGGPAARVLVIAARGLLVVQDDGPGVPELLLPLLGRRFERGAGAAEGSGLGLAIVETIARQSGARLRLQSPAQAGRGLRAELRFGKP